MAKFDYERLIIHNDNDSAATKHLKLIGAILHRIGNEWDSHYIVADIRFMCEDYLAKHGRMLPSEMKHNTECERDEE